MLLLVQTTVTVLVVLIKFEYLNKTRILINMTCLYLNHLIILSCPAKMARKRSCLIFICEYKGL